MSKEGDDGWDGGPLDPFDAAVVFIMVALGVLASLAGMAWMLSWVAELGVEVAGLALAGVLLGSIQLLLLIGRVVRRRAVQDWRATRSKSLTVRLVRLFLIGAVWPIWAGRVARPL